MYSPIRDDLIVSEDELGPEARAWIAALHAEANTTTVAVERLSDGRLLLRHLPDVDPVLLAHIRVTMARYHEALMNLT